MRFKTMFLVASILIFIGCSGSKEHKEAEPQFDLKEFGGQYSVLNFFDQDNADTLLVNIITFIGKKPPLADHLTRFDARFREHYIQQKDAYHFVYYHIGDDSTHYFYIARPARSVKGNTRGVGGMFRLQGELSIAGFEEVFNTPVADAKELRKIGAVLFNELISKKNVNDLLGDTSLIEWPDHRMKYDKEIFEWRYISDL
ncbi:MAG: hypothetical protein R6V49_02075 [Bacteroidales bacterium]